MAKEPWFKFFPSDYLLDAAVDALPLEAQAVLLRMWCLCHIEGSCPEEVAEIARKARLSPEAISKHRGRLDRFFELRDGRLYSRRMEEEKRKSEIARQGGKKRGEQLRSANRSADCSAQSQDQSLSHGQSQIETSPPCIEQGFDPSLQKKSKQYSQADFDQRDLRHFADARKVLELKINNGWGSNLTDEQIFEHQCAQAGVTPKHMRKVLARIEAEGTQREQTNQG